MVKILIPKKRIEVLRGYKDYNVEEGELVMIVTTDRLGEDEKVNSAILGVFKGTKYVDNTELRQKYSRRYHDEEYLLFSKAFVLRPPIIFGSVEIPVVEGYDQTSLKIGPKGRIRNIYSPQEEILRQLQSWPGFEAHAEWVSRLRKPYIE